MADALPLRRYDHADAAAVLALHDRALRDAGWVFAAPWPEEPVTEATLGIVEGYLEVGGEFLVGEVGGERVAMGGFVPVDETTVEVRRMAVDPDHQGRGYGRRLLEELEDRARAMGYDRATLETFERLEAARALYEADGYREVDREPHERTGDDRIRYRKRL